MRFPLPAALLCLVLLGRLPDLARAEEFIDSNGNPAIRAVNRSVSLAYLYNKIYYVEPSNGQSPANYYDYEEGHTKGGRVALTYMTAQNIYIHGEWSGTEGKLGYTGFTIGPPSVPINGTSRATTQEGNLKVGLGLPVGDSWMITPYLVYGRRYWMRELGLGTPGDYVESYNFWYGGLGFLTQYSPAEKWVFSGDASFGRTFDPTIHVPSAGLDHTALGPAPIVKAGIEADYRASKYVHVFVGFDYTYFAFWASTVQPSGFLEPASHTDLYNLTFGARFPF